MYLIKFQRNIKRKIVNAYEQVPQIYTMKSLAYTMKFMYLNIDN